MAKRPRDLNQLAKLVVDIASGERVDDVSDQKKKTLIVGRRGGLKGGPLRAVRLSPERRAEIARIAAQARWNKKP
jgi:hypothetical protein